MLDGNGTHIFTANGNYTFRFVDAAGNIGNVTASVNNINETIIIIQNNNYPFNISILYPLNTTYNLNVSSLKFIVSSTNASTKICWYKII